MSTVSGAAAVTRAAAAGRPRRRRGDRRRRLHRPVDGVLPRRADPSLRIAVLEAEHRRVRRVRPQRRLVLGAAAAVTVRRWPRGTGTGPPWPCTGPCSPPWTKSAGSPRPRGSTATTPRAARWPSPGRRRSGVRARAEVDEPAAFDAGLRLLDAGRGPRARAAPPACSAPPTPRTARRIHPARLVRGLADVVRAARACRSTSRRRPPRSGPAAVRTQHGTVRAAVVVRATEAYTADLPGLHRARGARLLADDRDRAAATVLLGRDAGLAGRETFSDHRHLIIYGQRTADDRLAFGGRGAPYHFGSRDPARLRPRADGSTPRCAGALASCSRARPTSRSPTPGAGRSGSPRDWSASVGLDRRRGLAWAGGYVGDGVGTRQPGRPHPGRPDHRARTELTALPWVGHQSAAGSPSRCAGSASTPPPP